MIKRVYVDNYKCMVNFEISLGDISLFLGQNGSGKSSVFQVLQMLVDFVGSAARVPALFRFDDRTRWQEQLVQSFEVDVAIPAGLCKYELAIEHLERSREGHKARVKHERLWLDNEPLLRFEGGDVQLYRDDHSEGPKYPFDWSQSAVASILPRHDNRHLTRFKEALRRTEIVQVIPSLMLAESGEEEERPSPRLENYASWYRHLSQDQGMAFQLTRTLQETLAGFRHFKFEQAGEQHRILKVCFSGGGERGLAEYSLAELSDGQRMLIALYTLLFASCSGNECKYTLCLDEPENFIALPEIQPWLVRLYDRCSAGEVQALLISHHPELINYLAAEAGFWFDHEPNMPARLTRITENDHSGLPISELVARGWLNG